MESKVCILIVLTVCLVGLSIGDPCPQNVQPGTSFMNWSNPNCGHMCRCLSNGEIGGCQRNCERPSPRIGRSTGDCPDDVSEGEPFWDDDCGIECRCIKDRMAMCPRLACDSTRAKPSKFQ